MEITKREILFSTIIVCVMTGLGIILSRPIITNVTKNALKICSMVQVKDSTNFDYIKRTDVGDFLAEGVLVTVDSVSIPDIKGYYGKIEKIKEKYTEHTRTVTETDSEGHTHTHTETYWEWDRVDSWEWEAKQVKFLGKVFNVKPLGYKYHAQYKETIKPKVKWYESEIRYKYYVAPTKDYGVIRGTVEDKTFKNLTFTSKDTIDKIIKKAENSIDGSPIAFWVLWIIITIGIVLLFCFEENEWLEDKEKARE